jgi:hypothetical protein
MSSRECGVSLESAFRLVQDALVESPECDTGLTVVKKAFGTHQGPSGGPEIVALIHVDICSYWYGHVMKHPKKNDMFVALLVWSDKLVNADNVPLFFRRFHYWIKDRLCYQPCTIQADDDAYAECPSLETAALALARMIRRFHIDLRWPEEDEPHYKDPCEMRILGIYALEGAMRADGSFPPIPTVTPLTVVKIRP